MPGDYAILAPVYDQIGMADYARQMTPRLIDYAQRTDWLGRRVAVLGCGTGASIEHLSQYSYTLIGVDNSAAMLDEARRKLDSPGLSLRWYQLDIREVNGQLGTVDLVFALNVMNDLASLRDLESVFQSVFHILENGKLFIFDMMTVQGLTEDGLAGDRLLINDPAHLAAVQTNDYDYERQMQTCQYVIFRHQGESWERTEARRVLRAFPVQAIASLLQRAGFVLKTLMDTNLQPIEPGASRTRRGIFVAEKPG